MEITKLEIEKLVYNDSFMAQKRNILKNDLWEEFLKLWRHNMSFKLWADRWSIDDIDDVRIKNAQTWFVIGYERGLRK